MRVRGLLLVVLVGALCLGAPAAAEDTHAAQGFVVTSDSRAVAEGPVRFVSEMGGLMFRAPTSPANCLVFGGEIRDALLEEHEYVRFVSRLPHRYLEQSRLPPVNHSYRTEPLQGRIEARLHPGSALVAGAETVSGIADRLEVLFRERDPHVLAGAGGKALEVHSHRDEIANQQVYGDFAVARLESPAAEVSGRVSVYLFNATLRVSDGRGWQERHAKVWDEALGPHLFLRHIRWLEVEAPASALSLVSCDANRYPIFTYSSLLSFANASVLTFDDASGLTGALPLEARSQGSSLWVRGDLSGTVEPGGVPDRPQAYRVHVHGDLRQFSVGGGPIRPLDAAQVASLSLAAVALSVVSLHLDRIVHAIARASVPFYSKLRKDQLLDVQARDALYRLIQQTPGINFLSLHKQVKNLEGTAPIAFGALAYHLGQMERFRLIVSKREGRYRRYFDTAANMGADTARVALLQTDPIPAIARTVLAAPGNTQAALHSKVGPSLGITRQALAYHLRRLEAKELIRRDLDGRFMRYVPTERLQRLSHFVARSEAPSGELAAVGTSS